MKIFTRVCIGCTLLIVVGVIYTQWQTKNFVESLPKPSVKNPDTSGETQRETFVAEPDTNAEIQSAGASPKNDDTESPSVSSSRDRAGTEVSKATDRETQHDVNDWRNDDAHRHEHSHQVDPWQSAEDIKALNASDTDIPTEALRSQLVDKFGDIPQVHTFVEMRERYRQDDTLTFDEYVQYFESMNYLFPSKETERSLKTFKDLQQTQNVQQ